jgi:hypothetical protein
MRQVPCGTERLKLGERAEVATGYSVPEKGSET